VAPSTEHLSILPMASNEFAMDQDSMPSWIPGWDKNTGSPPMFTGSSLRCRWAASKGKRAVLVETDDRTRPILQGLRISTIAEFVRNPESQYRNILFAMELWDARVSKLNSYYDVDTLKEAFAQTITAGYKHLPDETIDSFHKADLDDYLSHCELLKGEMGNICGSFFDLLGVAFPSSGKFATSIYPRLRVPGRYSFILASDGHIGHGPEFAQVGDVLCLLFG